MELDQLGGGRARADSNFSDLYQESQKDESDKDQDPTVASNLDQDLDSESPVSPDAPDGTEAVSPDMPAQALSAFEDSEPSDSIQEAPVDEAADNLRLRHHLNGKKNRKKHRKQQMQLQ